ncbi:TonB-dependent receptor [Flavobacterium sp. Sd200]|uniref:TonB-dependent receptor domain-containing protein n=1 Tax=Flavobacterium sp. Sd200 TaxID=2692211 RepID=UPI0013698C07|nr:TonB-dependent receptor [Flavobacterium sp. Sd200]MXN89951.1 TonB-dependent receptor [Flavobacterium sp. Sd200]
MKYLKNIAVLTLLLTAFTAFSQNPGAPRGNTVKVTGQVIEQETKQPLEFANVIIQTANNVTVAGGLTDASGKFDLAVAPGTYTIKYDFISFKPVVITGKQISGDTNLGTVAMAPDATVLNAVEITAERSTVEIKLDKRVYTVGNDMMVKGGTVSDVLDNVPSLSVDAEGNVALRGNQSVTILIDGRPSNLAGSNVAEVLRLLPADSVDKVEVITNPSARYDAEGGGGIVNIILKKGKANGFNGSAVLSTGDPANHGISTNLNYRSNNYNLFSNLGYNYRKNPGNSFTNSEYLDKDTNETTSYTNERRTNDRLRKGFNASLGAEWFLNETTTWTNSVSFRSNKGGNPAKTFYDNFDADNVFTNSRLRFSDQKDDETNMNYSTNLVKKFNDNGHELRIDASISHSDEDEDTNISDEFLNTADTSRNSYERTSNDQLEKRGLVQADYVLPIGEKSRFEAGYRGSFTSMKTDAVAETLVDGEYVNNTNYSNFLEYKEKVNALYTQYGSKAGKFSYLVGLRWEDSNIDVNVLTTGSFNNKRYNNFFPSAFLSYEFSQSSNVSLSYSRRINRPRGRFLNPFSGLQSNINIFRGNPDINPSKTHAIDLGYLKKWDKLTLSTSAYLNITDDTFQFVRQQNGDYVTQVVGGEDITDPTTGEVTIVDGQDIRTPVTLTTPINLSKEYRFGFEFNINYNPFKWWRINSNFNFFRNQTKGDYTFTYVNEDGVTINDYQDFNNTAYAWTTRLNSKITLPYKIDWQINGNYEGPQSNAQGRRVGVASANTALSKDILKDKATISLNVQDIFNSRKMKNETYIPNQVRSYSEMQWRQRQVTLSFTYRFNMSKADRQKEQQQRGQDGGGDEFMGG